MLMGDVNGHSTLWHTYTDYYKETLTSNTINNSNHTTLKTYISNRVPSITHLQTSSLDVIFVSTTLYNNTNQTLTKWKPIIYTTLTTNTTSLTEHSSINYKKVNMVIPT